MRPARFELATYGFVDRNPEFPNLLKLGQITEIITKQIVKFWTLVHILADFGQLFTHGFTHGKGSTQIHSRLP